MLIRDIMTKQVVTAPWDMPLDAALQIMQHRHIRRLPVLSDGQMVGIATEREARHAPGVTLRQIMRAPVITISPDDCAEHAAALMLKHRIGALPVVIHGELIGIVTESDIFRTFVTLLGGDHGFLRVTLPDTERMRSKVAGLLEQMASRIQAIIFSVRTPEILIVFRASAEEARDVLRMLREDWGFNILSYQIAPGELVTS